MANYIKQSLEEGETMIAYHAETDIKEHLRCDGIRRVHFREDNTPYFQMSPEEDLPQKLVTVAVDEIKSLLQEMWPFTQDKLQVLHP